MPGVTELIDDLLWRGLHPGLHRPRRAAQAARRRAGDVLCRASTRPRRACTSATSCRCSPRAGSSSPGTGRCCWSAARPGRSATRRRAASARSTRRRSSPAGCEQIRDQVAPFVTYDGDNAATLVNNLDWTGADVGDRVPARRRQALPGQPDAGPRGGPGPAGDRHQLHRVQLPAAAVARLLRAAPAARLHAAVRRLRPVGQHHRRRRLRPPARRRAGARVRDAAGHQGRRHEVRQDRGRRGLARPRR